MSLGALVSAGGNEAEAAAGHEMQRVAGILKA